MFRKKSRNPDFKNMQTVLEKKAPPRPVMYDFIIGADKEKLLTGKDYKTNTEFERVVTTIKAFDSGGYDHAPIIVRGLCFTRKEGSHAEGVQTKSLNEGAIIKDRKSFSDYVWPEITDCDFSIIEKAGEYMDKGMKMIPFSFDGILENTIGIVGYENLCMMLYDDEKLVGDIFENVGKRMVQYFTKCIEFDEVGAILCNDDWGFNSQTMFSPAVLRKYVFPWYKEIVKRCHEKGKYAILHSCGYYNDIIDDIINDIKFDGRHSYEDKIAKVENAYQDLHSKIAVMGGIDVDYLARASADDVYKRCKNMLKLSEKDGAYALGSGNSVPDYIPNENYLAMIKAGNEDF
jgi:uroporphyrinogen decarboxylase